MPNARLPLSRLTSRWPALAYPAYRRMMAVRFATTFGIQVQLVAVGWQVYDLSREPLYLGLIGLVQFVPAVALILVTGTVADRFQRRIVVAICLLIMVGCALVLMAVTLAGERDVWPFLALMGAVGVARAFLNPALQALMPNLVAIEHLGNAVSLNSIAARSGASLGPLAAVSSTTHPPPAPTAQWRRRFWSPPSSPRLSGGLDNESRPPARRSIRLRQASATSGRPKSFSARSRSTYSRA